MPATKKGDAPDVVTMVPTLRRLQTNTIMVPIIGITPYIPHKWGEKAKTMMRAKQSGETMRGRRAPKEPDQEAVDASYWLPDAGAVIPIPRAYGEGGQFEIGDRRPAIPASAFKAAMVGACRFFDGLPMTRAKALFFVEGDGGEQLVPLDFEIVEAHEDTPRNADGTADLRYRCYVLPEWRATLKVNFIGNVIDTGSVVSLADASGRLGVGD
jgi:hypothetical protein